MRRKNVIFLYILSVLLFISCASKGMMNGRVIDKSNGEPISNVKIIIPEFDTTYMTDSDGNFSIEDLSTGMYTIEIKKAKYHGIKPNVLVEKEKTNYLQFELVKRVMEHGTYKVEHKGCVICTTSGIIEGRIFDFTTGEPLTKSEIIVIGKNIKIAPDLNGYFFLKEMQPGKYNLEIKKTAYYTKIYEGIKVEIGKSTVLYPRLFQK
jgi:uncharacterized membrane protein